MKKALVKATPQESLPVRVNTRKTMITHLKNLNLVLTHLSNLESNLKYGFIRNNNPSAT